jgi:gluconokinase
VIVVVMGVAGAGKTTVGSGLAERLEARFIDGDRLHPPENILRMRRGIPLAYVDREPWLRELSALMIDHAEAGADLVVAASALARAYREQFRRAAPGVRFVYLACTPERLKARLEARTGHFMPVTLLESQLAALEPPGADEDALVLDAARPVEDLLDRIVRWLGVEA